MKSQHIIIPALMLFIIILPAAGDDDITASIGSSYRYEYHRTLGARNELFFQGDFKVNEFVNIGSGFSTAFHALPERMYITVSVGNLPSFLSYNLGFLTRDFSQYEISETSLFPTIALLTRYFEFELGSSFRWTKYYDTVFSAHILYRLQVNILDLKGWKLHYKMANFDSFRAENVTTLYHTLGNSIRINDKWLISADFGLHDAGQVAFSSYLTALYAEIGFRFLL
jgi:hypothetical protein